MATRATLLPLVRSFSTLFTPSIFFIFRGSWLVTSILSIPTYVSCLLVVLLIPWMKLFAPKDVSRGSSHRLRNRQAHAPHSVQSTWRRGRPWLCRLWFWLFSPSVHQGLPQTLSHWSHWRGGHSPSLEPSLVCYSIRELHQEQRCSSCVDHVVWPSRTCSLLWVANLDSLSYPLQNLQTAPPCWACSLAAPSTFASAHCGNSPPSWQCPPSQYCCCWCPRYGNPLPCPCQFMWTHHWPVLWHCCVTNFANWGAHKRHKLVKVEEPHCRQWSRTASVGQNACSTVGCPDTPAGNCNPCQCS